MKPALETLIRAAILAPSGDNTQPWRFIVDEEAQTINVEVDETRDRSPMNAGQRMARIACGAAIENMVQTARHNNWELTVEPGDGALLARLTLQGDGNQSGEIDEAIVRRSTNRHFYDGRPIEVEELAESLRTTSGDRNDNGISTHWVTDRVKLREIARVIGEADATMFGIPAMRKAFLENIRFDLPPSAAAEEGLPIASLGLGLPDRIGLKLLRYLPDWFIRYGGVLRSFRMRATELVDSASGICIIAANGDSPALDVSVGREFQRRWLAFSATGIAAQPMMSLPVMESWLASNSEANQSQSLRRDVAELNRQLRTSMQLDDSGRVAAIVRFGRTHSRQASPGRRVKRACIVVRRKEQVSESEFATASLA
jgi:hypothetical protein